jgi:hypothetical protein
MLLLACFLAALKFFEDLRSLVALLDAGEAASSPLAKPRES